MTNQNMVLLSLICTKSEVPGKSSPNPPIISSKSKVVTTQPLVENHVGRGLDVVVGVGSIEISVTKAKYNCIMNDHGRIYPEHNSTYVYLFFLINILYYITLIPYSKVFIDKDANMDCN